MKGILIFLLLLQNRSGAAQQAPVTFKNRSINEGLSQSSVVDLAFDAKGFVWLATQDGLNRYDGKTFTSLDKKFDDLTSGQSSRLGKVATAEDHSMWIISKGGLLEKLNLVTNTFQRRKIIHNQTNQVVTSILPDENGALWVGTEIGKLIYYDSRNNKILQVFDVPASTLPPAINAIYKDKQNRVWIAGSSLAYVCDGRLITAPVTPSTAVGRAPVFSAVTQDSAGRLWAGTWGQGLFVKDNGNLSFQSFNGYTSGDLPPGLVVEALLADSKGQLWVGSYGNGLFLVTDKKVQQFVNDKRNSLSIPFNDVLSVREDPNGGIWIGTDGGGLSYYSEALNNFVLFSNETVPPNIDIALVRSITTDRKGTIWVGTSNKGLTRLNNAQEPYKTWNFPSYKKSIYNPDRIVSLFSAPDDKIWVGTQGNGLIVFDPETEKISAWYQPDANPPYHIPDGTIWCILPGRDEQLWLGTGRSGLCLLDKKKGLQASYQPPAINSSADAIRCIIPFTDTTLFIGFEKRGVWTFNTIQRSFQRLNAEDLNNFLASGTTIKSLYYQAPLLYVGTDGSGLYAHNLSLGSGRLLTARDGLPNNTIYGILPDEGRYLWVSTNKGISRVDSEAAQSGPLPAHFTNYTVAQGLQSNEFNTGAHHRTPDGTLLFGGINGLNAFHPRDFRAGRQTERVAFTQVMIDNQPLRGDSAAPYKQRIRLTYKNHSFSFAFGALAYFASHQQHYYYKLEGYDQDWIDAEDRSYVSYTNIPPGTYQFLVVSAMPGAIDERAATKMLVEITGPFWKSATFLVAATLLLLSLLYALYRARIAQLLKLQTVRQGIASDLHDDIGSTLSNIHILSELSKKNLAVPAHATAFLERITEEVQASSQSLDDIIWSVNTHNDTWPETFSRMRRYATEVFENSKTNCHLEIEEGVGTKKLAMEKRRDVFMIYKEVINNIHRHAAATEVWINMSFKENHLVMQIRDNGKGFDPLAQTHRNGLKNLHARVAHWKGSIDISTNCEGTRVAIII